MSVKRAFYAINYTSHLSLKSVIVYATYFTCLKRVVLKVVKSFQEDTHAHVTMHAI